MYRKFLSILLALCSLLPIMAGTACASKDSSENKDNAGDPFQETTKIPGYTTQTVTGNPSALGATSKKGDTFPVISINVDDNEEILRKDIYLGASITVSNCPEQYAFENARAEVRKRGNGTFAMEKGAYRIKFVDKYNLFGQANGYGRSWVLLANSSDACMLRTHAVFAMAQKLENIEWTTSSSFVQLYINGTYRGVYQLAEQHNTSDGRIEINENPNVLDSDYLIELDKYASDDGERGVDWFRIGSFTYDGGSGKGTRVIDYLIRSDYNTPSRCRFLMEYFQKADNAILDGSYEEVSKYIDLPSFIDMYLLHELSRNGDVGWSSFYMVKKAGDKIYFTCPWDFDNTFGNDGRIHKNSYKYLHAGNGIQREKQSNRWYYLMFKQKWFVDMVAKRWNEVAKSMKDAATLEIDRIYNDFRDELLKNYTVWDVKKKSYGTDFDPPMVQDDYDEHVAFLKLYLNKRFLWLDDYFNSDKKYEQIGTPID